MQFQTENWMGFLPASVTLRLLTEICLPGTHNSAAYTLDLLHPIPDDNRYLKISPLLWFSPIKYFAKLWILTQNVDIYRQLEMGIRVLDFRLAFDGEEFWLVHAFSLVKLSKVLKDVKAFIKTHPTEVVIIRAKPGWEQRNTMFGETNRLEVEVLNALGRKYLISQVSGMPTLNECQQTGAPRVLFIYEVPTIYFWPSSIVQNFWANTNDIEELREEVNSVKKMSKIPMLFQEISFVLTPTDKDVKTSLFKYLTYQRYENLKRFANKTNELLINELENDFVNFSKFSFITMDFANYKAIMAVIALNYFQI